MAFYERMPVTVEQGHANTESHESSHPVDMVFQTVALDPFISETVTSMRPMAAAKKLLLKCDLKTGLHIRIAPVQMVMALQCLIENAIDATREGTITVSTRIDKTSVLLEVRNPGPHIPASIMAILFAPYATFGKPWGTGLGLAGTKVIIERQGGSIEARNLPDCVCFTMSLPLQAADPTLGVA